MRSQEGEFDLIIQGGTIVTPRRTITRGTLALRDGRIAAVGTTDDSWPGRARNRLTAVNCYIVPGLIDLHIHGAAGYDITPDDLNGLSATLAQHGVTGFLPTILPRDASSLRQSVSQIAVRMRQKVRGAQILGLHLEGPFLSAGQAGCLDRAQFRSPNLAEVDGLLAAAPEAIRRMTVAVELPGMDALLPRLVGAGIAVSLGHSTASFADVERAIPCGLTQATHTFNAMSGFHHRSAGAVGAVLLHEEILAELIADGRHVQGPAIDLLYRMKGAARIALVSDATPAARLAEGHYNWLGREVHSDGTACWTVEGTLAGSATLLDGAVRWLVRRGTIPLDQIVKMATCTPARALGLSEHKGSIEIGNDADLAIFDDSWHCRATIIGGMVVWGDGLEIGE